MKPISTFLFCCFVSFGILAQEAIDSVQTKKLEEVVIKGQRVFNDIERAPESAGTYLYAGKKNEIINLKSVNANIAEKTPRQIFAKIPGVFVYDMDGSGNQINISTRGLDPHRGWEFNNRFNGIITNSDMYGYPASHFSMPMESIDQIKLVRGTGSLQYGAQFGGMINYVAKKADTTKSFSFESINSIGSFGLQTSYNALSGKIGKLEYYIYYHKRVSNGYRDNGKSDAEGQSIRLAYHASKNVRILAELSRSNYVYQIPGPLTDSMFLANPRMSTRSRNYFNPDIYIPSLTLDWQLSDRTRLTWINSAVLGARSSVQLDKPATVVDMIDPVTLTYSARQVDIDRFNSYTSEFRVLHRHTLFNMPNILVVGAQAMNNDLQRQQLGKGTTGTDFDLSLSQPGWGRDLRFKTTNLAFFAENKINLTDKLSLSPGIRIESGESKMSGVISYYDPGQLPNLISHQFTLLGINTSYKVNENQNFYAGFSQAYRPVLFKDIIPASTYEQTDKNLKDASGYNLEAGYRGSFRSFRWDVSVFQLQYNNRLGSLSQKDVNGNFYLYRTNIGNSLTQGVELFAEQQFTFENTFGLSLFTSTSFFDARYRNASVRLGEANVSIDGNRVESVPDWISRSGLTVRFQQASISVLYSYTSQSFADAINTATPSANGAIGIVPAYGILDVNASWKISPQLFVRLNVNNLTDLQYFTKRPTFYPGPGVWSSDGRSMNISVGFKI